MVGLEKILGLFKENGLPNISEEDVRKFMDEYSVETFPEGGIDEARYLDKLARNLKNKNPELVVLVQKVYDSYPDDPGKAYEIVKGMVCMYEIFRRNSK